MLMMMTMMMMMMMRATGVSIGVWEREAAIKGQKITKVHQDGPGWAWTPGYQRIPGYQDNRTPDTWTSGYLDTRTSGYPYAWLDQYWPRWSRIYLVGVRVYLVKTRKWEPERTWFYQQGDQSQSVPGWDQVRPGQWTWSRYSLFKTGGTWVDQNWL